MPRAAGPNDKQTSLRLSGDLIAKLDAARNGRPLGEEVRARLEASFGGERQVITIEVDCNTGMVRRIS